MRLKMTLEFIADEDRQSVEVEESVEVMPGESLADHARDLGRELGDQLNHSTRGLRTPEE